MSFNLFVFEPELAPDDDAAFRSWYLSETTWDGSLDYNDPARCSARLGAWYAGMRRVFWPLNGPHRSRLGPWFRPDSFGDYAFSPHSIYVSFTWNRSDKAAEVSLIHARKLGLGVYYGSLDAAPWRPD